MRIHWVRVLMGLGIILPIAYATPMGTVTDGEMLIGKTILFAVMWLLLGLSIETK